MSILNICFAPDNNYVIPCSVAISSLLRNADKDDAINIKILDGGLTDENKKRIKDIVDCYFGNSLEFIAVEDDLFKKYNTKIWGTATAYRLKAASLFRDLDKILYLDCDIIVRKSLNKLYNSEMGECYAGFVPDIWHKFQKRRFPDKKQTYFNAGIMLINLKKWREDDIETKLEDWFDKNKNTIIYPDQDPLNMVFDGKILELSFQYNFVWMRQKDRNECKEIEDYKISAQDPAIVHFVFNKPFFTNSKYHEFGYLYFDEIKELPAKYQKKFKRFKIKRIKKRVYFRLFNFIPLLSYIDYGTEKFIYLFKIIPLLKIKEKGV